MPSPLGHLVFSIDLVSIWHFRDEIDKIAKFNKKRHPTLYTWTAGMLGSRPPEPWIRPPKTVREGLGSMPVWTAGRWTAVRTAVRSVSSHSALWDQPAHGGGAHGSGLTVPGRWAAPAKTDSMCQAETTELENQRTGFCQVLWDTWFSQ